MPTKTEQKALRLTYDTVLMIDVLAERWGPVKRLSFADVVAECVRRVYEQETKKQEKRR